MPKIGKLILKIILSVLGFLLLVFLIQTGIFYYKIKSGKIGELQFSKEFTASDIKLEKEEELNSAEILEFSAPRYGASSPALTIVEFGSFSCPYSKKASGSVREAMLKYGKDIAFIYRDFPLDDIYPDSSTLALAGRCANAQGKFWQFHDKVFQSESLDTATLPNQLGLNSEQFLSCVKSQTFSKDIEQDMIDGLKNSVRGTPTFFFISSAKPNEPIKIEGAIPSDALEKIIKSLLSLDR